MCIFDVGIADTVPLLTERDPVQEWNKDCLLFMVEDYDIACLSLGFIEKTKRNGEQKFSIVTILHECKRLVCFLGLKIAIRPGKGVCFRQHKGDRITF